MDGEGNIKIGDFGLATTSKQSVKFNNSDELLDERSEKEMTNLERQGGFALFCCSSAADQSYHSTDYSESLTSGVGTALYRAPEQESALDELQFQKSAHTSSGIRCAYNTKADLFSLGIILFEMCHKPFSTGMERVQSLLALRKSAPDFLATIAQIPENLKCIIGSLVQPDPLKRPEAVELQSSPLMPPRIQLDKGYLDEVLAAITVPHSDTARRVVTTLFQRKDQVLAEHEDLTYDQELNSSILRSLKMDSEPIDSGGKSRKKDQLPVFIPLEVQHSFENIAESVFLCHGGSKFSPSCIVPRCSLASFGDGDSSGTILHSSGSSWTMEQHLLEISSGNSLTKPRSVEFMTRTGTIVSLPMELVTPYARAVARLGIHHATRYHIDRVFRERDDISGSRSMHPLVSLEAVYDIVREDFSLKSSMSAQYFDVLASNTRLQICERRASVEVEVIATAVHVIDRIDPKRLFGQLFLRLGDSRLGNAILDLCAAPYPRLKALKVLSAICDNTLSQRWKPSTHDSISHAISLLQDIGLPAEVQRALKPFLKVLTTVSEPRSLLAAINNVTR